MARGGMHQRNQAIGGGERLLEGGTRNHPPLTAASLQFTYTVQMATLAELSSRGCHQEQWRRVVLLQSVTARRRRRRRLKRSQRCISSSGSTARRSVDHHGHRVRVHAMSGGKVAALVRTHRTGREQLVVVTTLAQDALRLLFVGQGDRRVLTEVAIGKGERRICERGELARCLFALSERELLCGGRGSSRRRRRGKGIGLARCPQVWTCATSSVTPFVVIVELELGTWSSPSQQGCATRFSSWRSRR
mmetsp:Transcript_52309/g.131378  ORF Transcript_52309/g.131378 Transcript_52309/m.131378 type:complete len:248 (-) Transcript_52309:695-1438(-)